MNSFSKIVLTVKHGKTCTPPELAFNKEALMQPAEWHHTGTQYMNINNEAALYADPSNTSCHQVGANYNWHSKKFTGTLKQRIQANCLDLVSSVNGITSIGEVIDTPESLTIIAPTWRLDAVKQ